MDPAAVAWRDKVGVAGPVEGSAKPSTRLLASGAWVLKTRVDLLFPSAEAARAWALESRAPGRRAAVWHPSKVWASARVEGGWLALTACRRLSTLRAEGSLDQRLAGWTRMLQIGVEVGTHHGLGLDLNPANFARAEGDPRLYYLDEEVYPSLELANLAGAMAARIPEEPAAPEGTWAAWGRALRTALALDARRAGALASELSRYPVAARFEAALRDLAEGLRVDPAVSRPRTAEVVCVLADVHANRPALDAVLADAREQGATRFLFLGDAVGYGPHPSACVARLAELRGAAWVRGNHDHVIATGALGEGMNSLARGTIDWTLGQLSPAERAWLGGLPTELREEGWLAVHGAPRDPHRFLAYVYELTYEDNLRRLAEDGVSVCFHGHTHLQLIHAELELGPTKLPGQRSLVLSARRRWLVNPGSVGQPRDGDPRAAYALWRPATGELQTRRVPYDVEETARAVERAGLPRRIAERLRSAS